MKENEPMLLLVEDDPADAVLIQRSIQKVGIPAQVVHLKDGDEAVAYLSAETSKSGASLPWLILMDLKLPRRSGLEVLQWIREQKSDISRVPVIMLSSSHHSVDIQRAYQYGVNSYLVKPETTDALLSMMTVLKTYWFYNNQNPQVASRQ
ncbi:MAG TPA: response regulator [Terriglobales bacterium]|jgi:CheY-like chemotaxis protein|nr:response regulator [Terriglobales bacterium]